MSKRPRILYVSYDGILEPLGYSQVYKYLAKQSENFQIDLISYEKTNDEHLSFNLSQLKLNLEKYNINWINRKYRSGLGWVSSIANLISLIFNVLYKISSQKYSVIHVRSYLPAIPLIFARPFTKTRFIFDIRGFWIDEKHDRLNWSKNSLKFLILKVLEKRLYKISDHVVTLTEESKKIITKKFNIPPTRITCIRTCVDIDEFNNFKNYSGELINLGYLGSVDTAYDFSLFLDLIRFFEKYFKNKYKVTILTKQIKLAEKQLNEIEFDFSWDVRFVSGNRLIESISKFTFLAFFLIKRPSLKASMPTKIAEALALGIPIICNSFNRDICELLEDNTLGLQINNRDEMNMFTASRIHKMISSDNRLSCQQAAKKYFNLEEGVIKYKKIYNNE